MEERIGKKVWLVFLNLLIVLFSFSACENDTDITEQIEDNLPDIKGYPVVETNQSTHYGNSTEIAPPNSGEAFYGQDAVYTGNTPSYTNNNNGAITDNVTGLMWSQTADMNGDGTIDTDDKMTYDEALAGAASFKLGGYDDWRLPTIKELYSLIMFSGIDPILEAQSPEGLVPFINTDFFGFGYGDIDADQRIIDAQFASSTLYVSTTMHGNETMFGVNFADGRIKGYPTGTMGDMPNANGYYVYYVRGNKDYGKNSFIDNGNGTITDEATGLMWTQSDNGTGLNWEDALKYAEDSELSGYSDWRLPNAKELQSIVDYTRSPATSGSAALDPIFNATEITNEAGDSDYPYYWSGTTHYSEGRRAENAVYIAFGRGLGSMFGEILDVHGAGCQRDDRKIEHTGGTGSEAPQGDITRTYNFVRLVRNVN